MAPAGRHCYSVVKPSAMWELGAASEWRSVLAEQAESLGTSQGPPDLPISSDTQA